MKRQKRKAIKNFVHINEEAEWLHLSPVQRISETAKLWKLYIALGGTLDPEPDPQSPFYFPKV